MIANCGHDERGQYSGGSSGDQHGDEWTIRTWYNRPWTHVLRYPDRKVGDTIAECAIQGANNDNIGYDQNQRYSFWDELKQVGYWPKNIKRPCETDCSASTAACVKATGYILGIEDLKSVSSDCYSGNIRNALSRAGFEVLTDSKYLNGDAYLYNGDILLCENHHVAVCVSDGKNVSRSSNTTVAKFKMGSISQLDLRKAANQVCHDACVYHWAYHDSKSLPPCEGDRKISCDRLIALSLWRLGYHDMRLGGETTVTFPDWLVHHGFSKITKTSYLTHGDIAYFTKDGLGDTQYTWENHMFLIDQYYGTGTIWKYDLGSQDRINRGTSQPDRTVLDEWSDKHFTAGYRVPRQDANIKKGYYKIVSGLGDQWVVDIADGSVEKRANVQLYKDNGTDAQVFLVEPLGDNTYKITNKKSGMVFDVAGGSVAPGINIQQYKPNGTDAQKFFIQACGDGYSTIQSYKSGLVLDVANGTAAKRTNIRQWSLNNTMAQKWKFVKV